MNIVLLGAPGAGKGTQAEVIRERLGIPTISTGAIMRAAIKEGTPLGETANRYIQDGKLVPDEVVIGLVRERLSQQDCKNGFILDGFPRTIPQAEALDAMENRIDKVLYLIVEDEVIVNRLSGRRVCENCGATYHITGQPSAKGDRCEKCDGKLIMRKDDKPETVLERLATYREQTLPLADYYRAQGKLCEIVGKDTVEETTREMMRFLEG